MRFATSLTLAFMFLTNWAPAASDELIVHEWGTFTSLQDETGRAIGAINEDTEALPSFVHSLIPSEQGKGFPISAEVTMRLETPVVYFHLHRGTTSMHLDFSAEFRGGWLTQFYPLAKTNYAKDKPMKITADTVGTLDWSNLLVGTGLTGPATDSHVWQAPRRVNAASITATSGESERYLFYRGVAHLDAPLRIARSGDQLRITSQIDPTIADPAALRIDTVWYYDVRPDGKCAWRKVEVAGSDRATEIPASFAENEYGDHLPSLRMEMMVDLLAGGLYEDEAKAMMNTWEEAYFKSPGSRLFFMVPRAWTDHYLPIRVSAAAKIERVMIGRIDLVTPQHRQIIDQLAQSAGAPGSPEVRQLMSQLGRFGRAMLRDEMARRSSPRLAAIVAAPN